MTLWNIGEIFKFVIICIRLKRNILYEYLVLKNSKYSYISRNMRNTNRIFHTEWYFSVILNAENEIIYRKFENEDIHLNLLFS